VKVTALLGTERCPLDDTVITVNVYVVPGQSDGCVNVVFGGSTRKQPAPFVWTQYHQFVPPVVTASHASETLLSVEAVIRRLVGAFDEGGFFAAGAAEVKRSADASSIVASAAFRMNMR
jgi:hypothetical protein